MERNSPWQQLCQLIRSKLLGGSGTKPIKEERYTVCAMTKLLEFGE